MAITDHLTMDNAKAYGPYAGGGAVAGIAVAVGLEKFLGLSRMASAGAAFATFATGCAWGVRVNRSTLPTDPVMEFINGIPDELIRTSLRAQLGGENNRGFRTDLEFSYAPDIDADTHAAPADVNLAYITIAKNGYTASLSPADLGQDACKHVVAFERAVLEKFGNDGLEAAKVDAVYHLLTSVVGDFPADRIKAGDTVNTFKFTPGNSQLNDRHFRSANEQSLNYDDLRTFGVDVFLNTLLQDAAVDGDGDSGS